VTILSVITPAATHNLTTPESVRAALGLDPEDAPDSQLAILIEQVSAAFARSCERVFHSERVVERVESDGPLVWLSRRPVTSVHSVKVWSTVDTYSELSVSEYELLSPEEGRLVILHGQSALTGLLDILAGDEPSWGKRSARVDVDYTGGFVTIPADLAALAISAVGRLRAELAKAHPELVSERLGDYSYTLRQQSAAAAIATGILSPEIERGLAPYRKLGVA
jgi:hypothetical protein